MQTDNVQQLNRTTAIRTYEPSSDRNATPHEFRPTERNVQTAQQRRTALTAGKITGYGAEMSSKNAQRPTPEIDRPEQPQKSWANIAATDRPKLKQLLEDLQDRIRRSQLMLYKAGLRLKK